MNYTVVISDTIESAQQFSTSTNDLANGTSITLFETSTKVQEMELENVTGTYYVMSLCYDKESTVEGSGRQSG